MGTSIPPGWKMDPNVNMFKKEKTPLFTVIEVTQCFENKQILKNPVLLESDKKRSYRYLLHRAAILALKAGNEQMALHSVIRVQGYTRTTARSRCCSFSFNK